MRQMSYSTSRISEKYMNNIIVNGSIDNKCNIDTHISLVRILVFVSIRSCLDQKENVLMTSWVAFLDYTSYRKGLKNKPTST